ncbi:hypothetical protein EIP91_011708 [Steccherinum ochraceum]|uniref:AB hydrolase-1 domain-containing protein n=1 Tax=Steccherinum ochraceum TaxID=92696 RepID=A0A4R0RQQ5_9APHY|nr:hypothetical protein EIP91_011708 [Steccherinum ochraceum]
MDPALFKTLKTSRGFDYRYYFSPATDSTKPTILFAHGFPCSAQDWRKVVPAFQTKGYGIVVPDMLGYDGTDKPTEVTAYRFSGLCQDLVDILDSHKLDKVVPIGTDWGSATCSRFAMFHPERTHATVLIGLGYFPCAPNMTYEEKMEESRRTVGYELFGYYEFFTEDDAPRVLDEHWDSFLSLLFSDDPSHWRTDMGPRGKFKEWVEHDRRSPLLSAMSLEDIERLSLVRKNGLAGPLNWYRTHTTNVTADDNKLIPPDHYAIQTPVLFVGCKRDAICVFSRELPPTQQFCKNLTVKEIDTGHWVLRENPEGLTQILLEWVEKL